MHIIVRGKIERILRKTITYDRLLRRPRVSIAALFDCYFFAYYMFYHALLIHIRVEESRAVPRSPSSTCSAVYAHINIFPGRFNPAVGCKVYAAR